MENGRLNNTTKHLKLLEWQQLFQRRSNYNSLIIDLVFLICILTTVTSAKPEVCLTATCFRAADQIVDYIDSNLDPCQDFYQFACGNFLENPAHTRDLTLSTESVIRNDIQTKIKYMLEQPIQSDDRISFQKAKQFYKACMNKPQIEMEGLAWMSSVFKHIGGWPTLQGYHWNKDQFDWEDVARQLREIGVNTDLLFKVTVDESRNKTQHLLGIHAIPYSPSTVDSYTRTIFLEYMGDIALIFGADRSIAIRDSADVLELLLKLSKAYEESVELNQIGLYDLYSLSELQDRFPSISWKKYINGILFKAGHITDDDKVVVGEPFYLDAIERILTTTSKRTLANFIAWQTLQHCINFLPAVVLERALQFMETLRGSLERVPRSNVCVKEILDRMDSVVAAEYIEHYFTENTMKDVEEMMLNIKTQLNINLKTTYELVDVAIENVLNNTLDIGSHSDLMKIHSENEAYNEAEVYEDKPLQSALNLDFISLNKEFENLRKPVKDNWLGNSSFVTGISVYHSEKEKLMRFPAGLFGGIYYQHDRPEYLNYGSVGSLIAYEMWQLPIMADLASSGELRNLLSMKFLIRDWYPNLDKESKAELLAALTGTKLAYDSYSIWVQQKGIEPRLPGLEYSPYQLFWISSAIRHCSKIPFKIPEGFPDNCLWYLPQFRVNGPLQHLDDFAKDFGCSVGSRMNPKKNDFDW